MGKPSMLSRKENLVGYQRFHKRTRGPWDKLSKVSATIYESIKALKASNHRSRSVAALRLLLKNKITEFETVSVLYLKQCFDDKTSQYLINRLSGGFQKPSDEPWECPNQISIETAYGGAWLATTRHPHKYQNSFIMNGKPFLSFSF